MPPGLIAIVDDDNAARVALESLVRSLGFTVTAFSSAEAFNADVRGRYESWKRSN